MAFIVIDRTQSAGIFAGDLVQIVNQLNNLYATIERAQERMDEMTTAQVEELYGVPDKGAQVKGTIDDAFTVLDETAAMVNLRTKIG